MRKYLPVAVCLIGILILGGCSGSQNVQSDGGGDPAVTISAASVSETATEATVTWATNVGASSQVNYGSTGAYGSTVSDPSMVTNHSLSLSSLTCNTTYHYQVISTGPSGNSAASADATFSTAACPINISAVSVTPTATSATVDWATNVGANSQVSYGTTSGYGSTVSDAAMVTSHSLLLTSLTCNTTYHYQVNSADAPSNSVSTSDATFTTGSCLKISAISISSLTVMGATVSWTTDLTASSQVNYGTTNAYGSTISDSTLVAAHSVSLTSLTCATTYHYQVSSVATPGNSADSSDSTFTTAACPISITGVSVITAPNSATVSWTTNVTGDTSASYGTTAQYGYSSTDATLVTDHSVTLDSLACNTAYHYQLSSVAGPGNSATTADATFTTGPCGGPVSDDFHSSVLNPMWNFYAQCCGFENLNGTDVLLVVPSTSTHDIYSVNQAVGLLQSIADVDFQVEVKFDSMVTQGDQVQGILVQQDAQDFVWFSVYNDGTTPRVFAVATIGGTPSVEYNDPITIAPGATSFWMRVARSGSNWTQSWSVDGTTYNTAPSFSQTLVVSAIGPAAGNDNDAQLDPAPSFTAAVDYFMNLASPISPTDGGMPPPPNQPVFNIWYGDNETFGQLGIPQQWVNVLGNVSAPSGIASASYTLNGGPSQFLRIGPNGTRLVDTGDFNVELDHASLNSGANTVVITATDNLGNTATHTVTVNWANTGQVWPLPYSIDWSTVTNISDVAQVVDGKWAIQPDGTVRTMQTGYDRVIALGDETWTDYQVTAEMTLNSVDCYDYGSGVIVGWSGATYAPNALQPDQPRSGHPFFGQGEYSTAGGPPSNVAMDLYANTPDYPETTLVRDTSGVRLTLGVKYVLKLAVQRNPGNTSSQLSLKIWQAGTPEPANWLLQANTDASTGSVLLACFRVDVSFGKITVVALP
jgi:hypothetical protein